MDGGFEPGIAVLLTWRVAGQQQSTNPPVLSFDRRWWSGGRSVRPQNNSGVVLWEATSHAGGIAGPPQASGKAEPCKE
jgi:hypothetical protein